MSTYYDILGLKTGASSIEIKAAFRRLAKLYHPDKNPSGKEHFTKILKAYEVLSDPVLKSSYDYKLSYASTATSTTRSTTTKTWSFDEKEMKRRQYYNEHIKKYAKATAQYETEPQSKNSYNEYKYVLFATPVAVALFLLIMRLAMPSGIKPAAALQNSTQSTAAVVSPAPTGIAPYSDFFGPGKADPLWHGNLKIVNQSSSDMVVCVFRYSHFLKSCFIAPHGNCDLSGLPEKPLQVRYSSGLNFDPGKSMGTPGVKGRFEKETAFYKSTAAVSPSANKNLVLNETGAGFEQISEQEFFKKAD